MNALGWDCGVLGIFQESSSGWNEMSWRKEEGNRPGGQREQVGEGLMGSVRVLPSPLRETESH